MKKAIVIGAGIGGLAAAVQLALKGYQTEVFEAAEGPGGKLHQFRLGDYRFDAGPSLFTMPQLVDELYTEAGLNPADHFQYQRLETACHYFYPDGLRFEAPGNPDAFAQKAAVTFGMDRARIRKYLDQCAEGMRTAGTIFLQKSLHKRKTWFSKDVLKTLAVMPHLNLFSSLHSTNEKALEDPRLVQLFDRFATYNGSDPYRTPGMMKVIASLEHGEGSYYPEGGMFQITLAVYHLALKLGVEFHFNQTVEEIRTKDEKAIGIRTPQGDVDADIVLSNMDIFPTYRKLLRNHPAPERSLKQERSSSAFIFYWGIRKSFPELGIHNIFFSRDYREEFKHLFNSSVPYSDPTVYVNVSSKYAPEDAPEGCENWFVMVNVPHHRGQDWESIGSGIRAQVLKRLSRDLKSDIASLIEVEKTWTPQGIEAQTFSHLGALYGSSSNNMWSAFLRHPNFSNNIKNLYFCGGSVHPGGGIPLAILSAKIACSMIPHAHES